MRKDEMIKIEFNKYNEIIQNYDLISSDIEYESLENELRIYDYIMNQLEIRLNRDFNFYNENQISRKNEDFEIYFNSEYSLYYDSDNKDYHYFFEIRDIDDDEYELFSIEILDDSSKYLDIIYYSIENYINSLIDYNKMIFDEEN